MFVRAVLCADAAGFSAWCQSNGFIGAGDGAESVSGAWLAIRVLCAADLDRVDIDRFDYAVDFWRKGDREFIQALDALAHTRLRDL